MARYKVHAPASEAEVEMAAKIVEALQPRLTQARFRDIHSIAVDRASQRVVMKTRFGNRSIAITEFNKIYSSDGN